MNRKGSMDRDLAEALALRALAHLAGAEPSMARFLAASGLAPADLARRAAEPELLAGVLDFLLANEAELLSFCAACGLEPELPARAREYLPGGHFGGGDRP